MTVRRLSSKIIFLAGILFQGVYTVRADQAGHNPWAHLPNKPLLVSQRNKDLPLPSTKEKPNTLQIKGSRPKAELSDIKKESKLENNLVNLRALEELYLPNKPSQVQIKELRPFTIIEVEQLVEANSPRLKSAALQIEQAKSLLLSAITAWYPTVNLKANGLPQYLNSESYRNPDFAYNNRTNTNQWKADGSVVVQWNLIDPARVPEIASARDTYEKAKFSYLAEFRSLRLNALTQYFLLQDSDEGVRIGKQSLRASLVSIRDAKARYKAGLANRLEVLEAETQLARDKQLLTGKINAQRIARRNLARVLSLPQGISPTAASPLRVLGSWEASLQESIIAAYKAREEIDAAILDISINNSNANAALASVQPTLSLYNSLSTTYYKGQQNIPTQSSIDMDDYGWTVSNTVGLSANWNIFDGGKAKALYRYNKQKAKEAEINFAATRDAIRQEVETSFANLEKASQDIATTTREVVASRESLRLARLRFKAGVASQREVVNNQRDLTAAEVRYLSAITSYNRSLAELRHRTGIDRIKACKSKDISYSKSEDLEELINIPIEPFPVVPACQASTISDSE